MNAVEAGMVSPGRSTLRTMRQVRTSSHTGNRRLDTKKPPGEAPCGRSVQIECEILDRHVQLLLNKCRNGFYPKRLKVTYFLSPSPA